MIVGAPCGRGMGTACPAAAVQTVSCWRGGEGRGRLQWRVRLVRTALGLSPPCPLTSGRGRGGHALPSVPLAW